MQDSDSDLEWSNHGINLNRSCVYVPLLVALTYAEERLFKPVVASVLAGKIRDSDSNVLNKSVTLKSSLAEHSRTFAL